MDMQQKASEVLALIKQSAPDVTFSLRADKGLHEFEADRGTVTHRICYSDDVFTQRDAHELAMVAASLFSLLRSDPGPARVVVRAGMFDTMLKTLGGYSRFTAAQP